MTRIFFILFSFLFVSATAQTKIIAHRGYWKTPENTSQNSLQSLKNAQDLHVYGSEFDVRMTKDKKLVICHDEHHGEMEISETNYSALKKVRLSNGEKLPTLKSYLKQGKANPNVKLIVEIKPAKTAALENELTELAVKEIKKAHSETQCEFISFSKNICVQAKKLMPGNVVQYLMGDISPSEIKNLGFNGIDYHYKILTTTNPDWIKQSKDLGLVVNTWTVNDLDIFKTLKAQNTDFITTDIPDILIKQTN